MIWGPECSTLPDQGKFATVVIDPPWPTRGGAKGSDVAPTAPEYYKKRDLMTLMDLACMPVPQILQEDAFVFIWTTMPHLYDAFKLLRGWDLGYIFTMVWDKNMARAPQASGFPKYNSEFVVVGRRGRPRFLTTKDFRTCNIWPVGEHSAKPEEFYELLRRVTPEPRIDVFNRRFIPGFWGWGNESPYPLIPGKEN